MHCRRFHLPPTRRDMLRRCANGFGAVALSALLGDRADGAWTASAPHFRPRAKNVIFLFMDGGPSQVDTFDPKPRLERDHGQPFKAKIEPTQFNNIGKTLKSPWRFTRHGHSGIPISELFPNVARV